MHANTTESGVANTARMRTIFSPGQLEAVDSCFGLAGPHQHGVANIPGGSFRHTDLVLGSYAMLMRPSKAETAVPGMAAN